MRRRGRTNHVHSSSRFDRTTRSLLRALLAYVVGFRDLITLTEVASDPRWDAARKLPGWTPVRGTGGTGPEECGLLFKRTKWELAAHRVVPLSRRVVPGRGTRVWALVVVLRHRYTGQALRVVVAHLPAHVEGKFWQAPNDPGVICYRECVASLSALARTSFPGTTLVVADWNLDWRISWVRTYLRAQFPEFVFTFGQGRTPRHGGTHGGRLIDYSATNGVVLAAGLLPDDTSSDHRPYLERIRLVYPPK